MFYFTFRLISLQLKLLKTMTKVFRLRIKVKLSMQCVFSMLLKHFTPVAIVEEWVDGPKPKLFSSQHSSITNTSLKWIGKKDWMLLAESVASIIHKNDSLLPKPNSFY